LGDGLANALWLLAAVVPLLVGVGLLSLRRGPSGARTFLLWSVVVLVGTIVVRLVQIRSY
jgi:hypothetical protein